MKNTGNGSTVRRCCCTTREPVQGGVQGVDGTRRKKQVEAAGCASRLIRSDVPFWDDQTKVRVAVCLVAK